MRNRVCCTLAAVLLMSIAPEQAHAQQPAAGTYTCYTFYISSQLQLRWRTRPLSMEQELAQVLAQQTTIVPAGIGVALDGRGGYRIIGARGAGAYRFDAATQRVTFDGEGAKLKFRKYFVTRNGVSVMQFYPDPDVFYQCETNARSAQSTGSPAGGQNSGTAPQTPAAPAPGSVAGRYGGQYNCGNGDTPLQLQLAYSSSGAVVGEVRFGGANNVPRGAYTVEGSYAAGILSLTAMRWIQRPDGYGMVGFFGRASGDRLTGTLPGVGCDPSGFDLTRQR
jgi:hypothetical protein